MSIKRYFYITIDVLTALHLYAYGETIKIFPDFDKLNVSYIQNFLVTSMTTIYKIFTADPNAMVLSPWVISIYQYEEDDYTYIVGTRSSEFLKDSKHKQELL